MIFWNGEVMVLGALDIFNGLGNHKNEDFRFPGKDSFALVETSMSINIYGCPPVRPYLVPPGGSADPPPHKVTPHKVTPHKVGGTRLGKMCEVEF